jgi:hypothetical protein
MTDRRGNLHLSFRIGALLLLAPLALPGISGRAGAQAPPSTGLGLADPSAPLALTPDQRTAIRDAVRQDKLKPDGKMPPNTPISIGVQLPASIALKILPDAALAQAPAAKTVQYTWINNQVVLVDPTNMRVVDIIRP